MRSINPVLGCKWDTFWHWAYVDSTGQETAGRKAVGLAGWWGFEIRLQLTRAWRNGPGKNSESNSNTKCTFKRILPTPGSWWASPPYLNSMGKKYKIKETKTVLVQHWCKLLGSKFCSWPEGLLDFLWTFSCVGPQCQLICGHIYIYMYIYVCAHTTSHN